MRLFTKRQLKAITKLGDNKIYRMINAGTFPEPIYLGPKSPRWVEEELDRWLAEHLKQRTEKPDDNEPVRARAREAAKVSVMVRAGKISKRRGRPPGSKNRPKETELNKAADES